MAQHLLQKRLRNRWELRFDLRAKHIGVNGLAQQQTAKQRPKLIDVDPPRIERMPVRCEEPGSRVDRLGKLQSIAVGQFRRTELRIGVRAAKTSLGRSGGQCRLELVVDGHRVDVDRAVRPPVFVQRPHLETEPMHQAQALLQGPRPGIFQQLG